MPKRSTRKKLTVLIILQKTADARGNTEKHEKNEPKEYVTVELSNFARIGKGVIAKSIGLQKNYIEVYEKGERKLNERQSGCLGCPVYQAKCQMRDYDVTDALGFLESQCECCSQAVYTTEYKINRKYINEKNQFGYQPTLKSCAIKLLLTYHFLQPDGNGALKDISIKGLAELIGCTTATIRANNKVLAEYGYCYICDSGLYDNHINVILPEYKDYHKTAAEGGRGYITMSASMLEKILNIEGLNTLRLNLKGIIEVDNASFGNIENPEMESATASYQKLRGFLPDYCKRNVIIKALQQDSSIFKLTYHDNAVTFDINPEFAQKNMRGSMLINEEAKMKEYIETLNQTLSMAGEDYIKGADPIVDARLAGFHIADANGYTQLPVSDKDYKDLASMCVQYNRDIVQNAVITAYNNYTMLGKAIKNLGALIRTIIRRCLSASRAA